MKKPSFTLALLTGILRRLVKKGTLTLVDADGALHRFGDNGPPRAIMHVTDPKVYAGLVFSPELKLGESYMDGTLFFESSTVSDFLHIVRLNSWRKRRGPIARAAADAAARLGRLSQNNPARRARRNVAHHYDISNDMFRLFLDREMNYSCAYFEAPGLTLEEAQRAKLRHIASKLRVAPGMKVLDIGCGWGAMARYLAEEFNAQVVGVTLSEGQYDEARRRARERGLSDRIEFRLCDYREVNESFDRIVSIGMFEHVGLPHYPEFFAAVSERLREDGSALLHSIGIKKGPHATGPWVRKYIFPGGYTPTLSETLAAAENADLWITDIEIWRLHYAETLKEWARRFAATRDKAATILDERFCRMWEFYLAASESAFRHGENMVFQIQLAKRVDAIPLTRDYAFEAEQTLRAQDDAALLSAHRFRNHGF